MDKSYYTIIKIIFIFFLISLTSNIIKNFMILSYFDEDIKNMVGISSYASLINWNIVFLYCVGNCFIYLLYGYRYFSIKYCFI